MLNKENIKIEAIREVKGVQGNWKLGHVVSFFSSVKNVVLTNLFYASQLLVREMINPLFSFLSGTKNHLLCDKGADPESAASPHTLQNGDTVTHSDAGIQYICSCS